MKRQLVPAKGYREHVVEREWLNKHVEIKSVGLGKLSLCETSTHRAPYSCMSVKTKIG